MQVNCFIVYYLQMTLDEHYYEDPDYVCPSLDGSTLFVKGHV